MSIAPPTRRHALRTARILSLCLLLAQLPLAACAPAQGKCVSGPSDPPPATALPGEPEKAIAAVLDDWHAAAAAAEEERYFAHLAEGSVFLGTDASERWDKAAFRAYAHPHFAKGKAWTMRAVRRAVVIAEGGRAAWFDEDLETARLGPARGSGALVLTGDGWRIAHYNLTVPIPNDRFDAVKGLIAGAPAAPSPPVPEAPGQP